MHTVTARRRNPDSPEHEVQFFHDQIDSAAMAATVASLLATFGWQTDLDRKRINP